MIAFRHNPATKLFGAGRGFAALSPGLKGQPFCVFAAEVGMEGRTRALGLYDSASASPGRVGMRVHREMLLAGGMRKIESA